MAHLEETASRHSPRVHGGHHPVSRSPLQPFNQLQSYMALEQSRNLNSKTKGGIICITQMPGALEKWFLRPHEREATVTATKDICGICQTTGEALKQSGESSEEE